MDLSFLKKIGIPKFSLKFLAGKPSQVAGIDIGISSSKVVQLRYSGERAILESYGELSNENYFKEISAAGGGFLRYPDQDVALLLKDILKESNITTKEVVMSVPATSSFVTSLTFPVMPRAEIETAIPFEARKHIPISIAEVVLDWEIIEQNEDEPDKVKVIMVAVPRETVDKMKRVAELTGVDLRAVEIENFSLVRSLVGPDQTPTAILNLGSQSSTIVLVDRGRLLVSHNLNRGAREITRALEKGLSVDFSKAETLKKEIGLSEKLDDREAVSVITPILDVLFTEIERIISLHNRKTSRQIQKINLTGGGSNLKGIIEYTSMRFGLEVTRGNPFARIVTPAFLQQNLRELGPGFSVAVGLALREIISS